MNTDWQRLKVSSSGIPKWDSFTPYILEVLKNGEEKTKGVIIIRVLVFFRNTWRIKKSRVSNNESSQSILYKRIDFALADLYKINAINRPKRAVYQISEKGSVLLRKYGDALITEFLQEQPEHKAYMEELELRIKWSENKF